MCRTMTTHKRILSALGNSPTRRNLFGPVDREQLQMEYQAALRKDQEDASRRWAFDFVSETPLEGGDFQWEGIPGNKVPLLYRSCMLGLGQEERQRAEGATVTPSRVRAGSSKSGKENIPLTPQRVAVNLQKLEKTPEKVESTKLKRKQTNITDFYQAKRRVVGTPRKSGQ
ncbi:cyclin-dependent kinase inhibitor 1 [Polymixia lowei]